MPPLWPRLLHIALLSAGMIASQAVAEKPAPADSPALPAWRSWLHSGPPMLESDNQTLRANFKALPPAERADAARYIFDTWDVKHSTEVYYLIEDVDLSFPKLVTQWAEKDFETVFRRAEEWEGFHGNVLRIALVRQMGERNPLEAARFMRTRLNPMSKQYYYYVTVEGLVPTLANKPMSEVMPALASIASGQYGLDEFRWLDSSSYLLGGGRPWNSANLDADWSFVLSQNPGPLRTFMLHTVLHRKLEKDFVSAIKTDLGQEDIPATLLQKSMAATAPKDPLEVLTLFPDANLLLLEAWVESLIQSKKAPDWPQWAESVLKLEPATRRNRAVAKFTRIRLLHDEFPARQWAATLADPDARRLAEEQVQVSEIIHQSTENWGKARAAASALTDADARRRALEGVFKAGTHFTLKEITAEAQDSVSDLREMDALLDAWTLGEFTLAAREKHRQNELFPLLLTMRRPGIRQTMTVEYTHIGRFIGFDAIREAIQNTALHAAEKQLLLQRVSTDEVDGLIDGFHPDDVVGGAKTAMDATLRIEDPDQRFVQQRGIVHHAVMDNVQEAKHQVEAAHVDAETKARLMKEWERVSRWYRAQDEKAE